MLRIWFSFMTWSTCFDFTMSDFFSIFRAKYLFVSLCLASFTRPNEPVPRVLRIS
jgi:hypothetical protein